MEPYNSEDGLNGHNGLCILRRNPYCWQTLSLGNHEQLNIFQNTDHATYPTRFELNKTTEKPVISDVQYINDQLNRSTRFELNETTVIISNKATLHLKKTKHHYIS